MRKIGLVIAAVVVGFGLSLAVIGCGSSPTTGKDKMGADKMNTDMKMGGDKMDGGKMGGDKMDGGKMNKK